MSEEPITAERLVDLGFDAHDASDGQGCWKWQAIQLRMFGDQWRINIGDWWEWFPNQTIDGLRAFIHAMGSKFKDEE